MRNYNRPHRDPLDKTLTALFVTTLLACAVWAIISFAGAQPAPPADKPTQAVRDTPTVAAFAVSYDGGMAAAATLPTVEAVEVEPEPTEAVETLTHIGKLQIYGYTPTCKHCCGKTDGITASGVVAEVGRTVAMKDYEFGTEIYIDGLGYFVVEDRGVGKGVVDVACVDHKACYAITGKHDVYIVERGA